MMKYIIYVINCLLIVSIPAMIITGAKNDTEKISTAIDIKKVNSLNLSTKQDFLEQEVPKVEEEKEIEPEEKENVEKITVVEEEVTPPAEPIQEESPVIEQEPKEEVVNDVLQTLIGTMSGYGPDCRGCSGYTSSGYNINNGIYYHDETYGEVRILAGDRSLKLGSIVRIKGSKLGDLIGIVLDRGNAVGIGKSHLFDLLFPSEREAYVYGISSNVTFEVLRYGY